ncbi:MAG: hypothetical protein WAK60_08975 [Sedimentisphaerales bacterium]
MHILIHRIVASSNFIVLIMSFLKYKAPVIGGIIGAVIGAVKHPGSFEWISTGMIGGGLSAVIFMFWPTYTAIYIYLTILVYRVVLSAEASMTKANSWKKDFPKSLN